MLQLVTLNFGKHAPALIRPSEDNSIYMSWGLKLWSTRLAQHLNLLRLGVILRNLSFSFCWFPSRTPLLGLKLSRDSGQSSTRVSGSFWREDGSCFQDKCSEGILFQQCDMDVRSGTTARILTPKGSQSGSRRN